ncbi:gremlin-2-like [Petromyzon marinus]|uniref:Gremlin-2-like isoform X2 n=1 Tax=Petromyzon marinus TaxID=7757 RepID=A0AAJ7X426_PETMA|nr:gremlin-2-like isoform X2 [Petromyzon marinus]
MGGEQQRVGREAASRSSNQRLSWNIAQCKKPSARVTQLTTRPPVEMPLVVVTGSTRPPAGTTPRSTLQVASRHRGRTGLSLHVATILLLSLCCAQSLTQGPKRQAAAAARPPGDLPSPRKERLNSSAGRAPKDEVLASSQDALVVTERRYLKSDWCKTQPLRQTVSEEGCTSRTVINRFCYGQCNSFYIPRGAGGPLGVHAFQSCAFCKPQQVGTFAVSLDCPGRQPAVTRKLVPRIKRCRCMSVSVGD